MSELTEDVCQRLQAIIRNSLAVCVQSRDRGVVLNPHGQHHFIFDPTCFSFILGLVTDLKVVQAERRASDELPFRCFRADPSHVPSVSALMSDKLFAPLSFDVVHWGYPQLAMASVKTLTDHVFLLSKMLRPLGYVTGYVPDAHQILKKLALSRGPREGEVYPGVDCRSPARPGDEGKAIDQVGWGHAVVLDVHGFQALASPGRGQVTYMCNWPLFRDSMLRLGYRLVSTQLLHEDKSLASEAGDMEEDDSLLGTDDLEAPGKKPKTADALFRPPPTSEERAKKRAREVGSLIRVFVFQRLGGDSGRGGGTQKNKQGHEQRPKQ